MLWTCELQASGVVRLTFLGHRAVAFVGRYVFVYQGTAAGVLAALFAATIPDRSHIHKVDLVQSKVKIDFGLDLRMAAHRCIAVAARKHADCVDTLRFFDSLRTGLGDAVVVQVRSALLWCVCGGAGCPCVCGVIPSCLFVP